MSLTPVKTAQEFDKEFIHCLEVAKLPQTKQREIVDDALFLLYSFACSEQSTDRQEEDIRIAIQLLTRHDLGYAEMEGYSEGVYCVEENQVSEPKLV